MVQNLITLPDGDATLFQNQNAVHPQPQGAGGGQHGMIALSLTAGHDQVVTFTFASWSRYFSFLTLLPPKATPQRSSRLIHTLVPSSRLIYGSRYMGVGNSPRDSFSK
jgi:hypothetical protein